MEFIQDPVIQWALAGAVALLGMFLLFNWLDKRLQDSAALDDTSEVHVGYETQAPTDLDRLVTALYDDQYREEEPVREYAPEGVQYFRGTMVTCPSCEEILARAIRHVYKGERSRNVSRAFLPEKHYESDVLHTCPKCGAGTARWASEGDRPVIELHTDTGWQ